jgi:hypothetical protein
MLAQPRQQEQERGGDDRKCVIAIERSGASTRRPTHGKDGIADTTVRQREASLVKSRSKVKDKTRVRSAGSGVYVKGHSLNIDSQ